MKIGFALYGSPTSEATLWKEAQEVTVQNGIFNVVLGADKGNLLDAVLFQKPLYLGIAVDPDAEMKPRQALAAVGYAFQAKNSETLGGLQASEIVAAAADEVRTPISALPFTISASGSYFVTGDLTLADTAVHGITVSADNVTIDLMGFSLIGAGSGTGRGIFMNGRSNVEVRDGTVRGFGSVGIDEANSAAGRQHRVINVRVHANASYGMRLLGEGHIVKDCTAGGNGSTGLNIGLGATVTGNTAYDKGGGGIFAGANSVITRNTARANGSSGINTAAGSIVLHSTASDNGSFGIGAGDGSTVTGNTVNNNDGIGIWAITGVAVTDNAAWANNQSDWSGGGGIRAEGDSLVKGNTLRGNLQNNIVVAGSDNAVEENLVTDSVNGINFTAAGNFYANNRAAGNTANYAGSVPAGAGDGGGNVGF